MKTGTMQNMKSCRNIIEKSFKHINRAQTKNSKWIIENTLTLSYIIPKSLSQNLINLFWISLPENMRFILFFSFGKKNHVNTGPTTTVAQCRRKSFKYTTLKLPLFLLIRLIWVKMYSSIYPGYYSTTWNTIRIVPRRTSISGHFFCCCWSNYETHRITCCV